jgi:hypothetical protein
MGMIMKNLDDLQTWLENVGSILLCFITSNFMMCKSFDDSYVCVVREEH